MPQAIRETEIETEGMITLNEIWPSPELKPEYQAIVQQALSKHKVPPGPWLDYRNHLQQYEPFNNYLNWGTTRNFSNAPTMRLDEDGVPQVLYGKQFQYNPVTIAQYALHMHGRSLSGEQVRKLFLKAVDRLLSMQDASGALRYPFVFHYFLKRLEVGWASGMTQGQALSVLSRAYDLTGDPLYLERGNEAIRFMLMPVDEGGTADTLKHLHPSLEHYPIYEEYPVTPCPYTLNGFLFGLLGLYDWSRTAPHMNGEAAALAGQAFDRGAETVRHILPYYDMGGYTTYDLSHLIYHRKPYPAGPYHAIHIYLLHALHSITGYGEFKHYEKLWASYLD